MRSRLVTARTSGRATKHAPPRGDAVAIHSHCAGGARPLAATEDLVAHAAAKDLIEEVGDYGARRVGAHVLQRVKLDLLARAVRRRRRRRRGARVTAT